VDIVRAWRPAAARAIEEIRRNEICSLRPHHRGTGQGWHDQDRRSDYNAYFIDILIICYSFKIDLRPLFSAIDEYYSPCGIKQRIGPFWEGMTACELVQAQAK